MMLCFVLGIGEDLLGSGDCSVTERIDRMFLGGVIQQPVSSVLLV